MEGGVLAILEQVEKNTLCTRDSSLDVCVCVCVRARLPKDQVRGGVLTLKIWLFAPFPVKTTHISVHHSKKTPAQHRVQQIKTPAFISTTRWKSKERLSRPCVGNLDPAPNKCCFH